MSSPLSPLPATARPSPSSRPPLSAAEQAALEERSAGVLATLRAAVSEFGGEDSLCFANSLGAEDIVLTDLIFRHQLPITVFSLDTGRLPAETYELIAAVESHYQRRLQIWFPQADAVEAHVRSHGINAFYESVALRKACCEVRKLAPLRRALAGKRAWITGLRASQSVTREALPLRQFDDANGLVKLNPLHDWSEAEVWHYISHHGLPYNALHDRFYPSIGCAPCTRAITPGEDIRAGRWWWEQPDSRECGLHRTPARALA